MFLNLKELIGFGSDLTINSQSIESLYVSSTTAFITMISGKEIEIELPKEEREKSRLLNSIKDFLK